MYVLSAVASSAFAAIFAAASASTASFSSVLTAAIAASAASFADVTPARFPALSIAESPSVFAAVSTVQFDAE